MRTLIIAATILAPAAALAGGYVLPNENPRDLALAQAAVAAQTGAEAIFLNTAALAGQDGLNVSFGAEMLINQTDWSDPTLGSASLSQSNFPPTAAISYGAKLDNGMAWGAGIGMGLPAGGSLVWPSGWAGQEFIQSVEQRVFLIGAGAAFQPLPYLKVGVAYLRFQAEEELHQKINYLDGHYGDAGLALSGGANGFAAAIEVKVPTIPLTFGVNYSHSADLPLSGNAHFTDVPAGFQDMIHDQAVTEQLKIPNVLFVGAAYEVIPNLKVMAAYDFERWSVYKEDKFEGADGFSVTVDRKYKNAYVLRLGGEWEKTPFLPELTLRAGVLRSMSDQPSTTVSPTLTDGNSTALSIGAGYNVMPALRVDVGYQHAFFDNVTASGGEALAGTYKTKVDLVSIGLNWRSDLKFLSGK